MALLIQSSNRIEMLQHNLSNQLASRPLSSPLATEVIVVPTYAMARWLNLRFAQQQGIAANIRYPLPATWLWDIAAGLVDGTPEYDPLGRDTMSWRIFSCLPDLLEQPAFNTLQQYLVADNSDIKRWQLATRIADCFERYQLYRPGLIRTWSEQADDHWQALIWQASVEDLEHHRVAILERLILKLKQPETPPGLPERISLFALSSLPPLFIEVIHALAQHTSIRLYQHSPTNQYWADLKSRKAVAQMRLSSPVEAEYYQTGNDLLASWGRQGQILQDLLLEQDAQLSCEIDDYQAPGTTSLLHAVQQSIFDIDAEFINTRLDDSISVHICHSPMRECQVLHNHLLAKLDNDPALSPEDILVMVPDISRYAPYIEAIFGGDENQTRPNLAWNLSDTTVADEHPLVLSFLQLLKLPGSRFTHSEIISLLQVEEIRHCFQIDSQALEDIYEILDEVRVRWGIDGAHKKSLNLPETIQNTWQQAKQRIFAGYAFGDTQLWDGIAPLENMEGSRAESLGKFWHFFARLEYWHQQLASHSSGREWRQRLNQLLDDFFQEQDYANSNLQTIRDCIDTLSLADNCLIAPALLNHWMESQLAGREVHGRLFSGGVTFCGMRPMRSLPFKIICLLGMDDLAFPRREHPAEFDLMAKHWQPGDPLKGDEDRYLMLETLLCARQTLYISYSGRSLKDNSPLQPSVLVGELLEFIDKQLEVKDCQSISSAITKAYPMQAFAPENYLGSIANYDRYWCDIAATLQSPESTPEVKPWPHQRLSLTRSGEQVISLDQLKRFVAHPIRYFFNHSLNLRLEQTVQTEDDEPFELDALAQWSIKQRITGALLTQQKIGIENLKAEAGLPHSYAGELSFHAIESQLEKLLPVLADYQNLPRQVSSFYHQFDNGCRFSAQVDQYYPGKGLMHYSTAALKGKHLLAIWLDHLVLCASRQLKADENTMLICGDRHYRLTTLEADESLMQLEDYCDLFTNGMIRPLPVFPASSFAWAKKQFEGKSVSTALNQWQGVAFKGLPGDKDDAYIQLALRRVTVHPLDEPEFAELATRIYQPVLRQVIEL